MESMRIHTILFTLLLACKLGEGIYFIDACPFWGSKTGGLAIGLRDMSKTRYDNVQEELSHCPSVSRNTWKVPSYEDWLNMFRNCSY